MALTTKHEHEETAAAAHEQGGYFTAKQAKQAGYAYPHLDYHVSAGNFERVEHGLYRLASIPRGENDDVPDPVAVGGVLVLPAT